MASPEVHHLFHHPIADHSFSADRQTLAVARDNNVELYNRSGNKFVLQDELKGHDKTVTSVDIAPNSGRIVTCSQGMPDFVLFQEKKDSINTRYDVFADPPDNRSKRICLGAITFWVETYSSSSSYQSSSYVCAMVPV